MLRALQLFGFGVSPLQRWKTTDLFFTFIPIPRPRSRLGLLLPSVSLPNRRFFRRFHIDMSASCFGSNADSEVSSSSTVLPSMAHKRKINFCQSCGGPTKHVIPEGEEKMRAVCTLCEKIYYENPKMVVGGLIEHNDKILLCKRKIQPSYGLWTLPAGFMEIGESAAEGATRETLEEACAEVEVLSPFAQLDIPLIGQSYIIFRAKLKKPHFAPGPESLECALFSLNDIPFDSLAFSSIFVTLKMYIEDVKTGKLKFHYCTINKRCHDSSLYKEESWNGMEFLHLPLWNSVLSFLCASWIEFSKISSGPVWKQKASNSPIKENLNP